LLRISITGEELGSDIFEKANLYFHYVVKYLVAETQQCKVHCGHKARQTGEFSSLKSAKKYLNYHSHAHNFASIGRPLALTASEIS
jgi:hypothetical protein